MKLENIHRTVIWTPNAKQSEYAARGAEMFPNKALQLTPIPLALQSGR
jgi:hypothetical protein